MSETGSPAPSVSHALTKINSVFAQSIMEDEMSILNDAPMINYYPPMIKCDGCRMDMINCEC